MNQQQSYSSASGGIGFAGLLTITFVVLKLTGVISWSWWWITSPLWIGFSVAAIVIAIAALIFVSITSSGK